MDVYFDSAIIVKLYVQETNSADAIRLVSAHKAPYILTWWQTLEVRNAIRLKAFRGEITLTEMTQSLLALDADAGSGRWIRPVHNVVALEQKAEALSAANAATVGCRSLDIIHVAAALVIGVKEFVTLDHRQAALARAAGLTVRS